MPQQPHAAPQPPADATPEKMAFSVGSKPVDSNGNGYPDLIRCSVVLFDRVHPTPFYAPGTLQIEIYPGGQYGIPNAEPITVWHISPEEMLNCRSRAQYGACYTLSITLLKNISDVMPLQRADMVCTWTSLDGTLTVKSDGIRSLQLGRN